MIKVPLTRQSSNYTCGVAALQSLLGYYNIKIREDKLSKEVKCTPNYGTPNWEIVKYLNNLGFDAATRTKTQLDVIRSEIDANRPVIVAIQAWKRDDDNRRWSDIWDCGHYVLIIGYDHEKLFFMDPSTLGNYTFIGIEEFLERWHDIDQNNEIVEQLAVIVKPNEEITYFDPNLITKIG